MSLVLHKMSRSELIEQISACLNKVPHEKSKARIVFRDHGQMSVVKVEETPKGVFLYPFAPNHPLIAMAPHMGSKMHDHSAEEIVEALKACTSEDVYVEWPKDDPHTVVGKVLTVGTCDELDVFMWPVPADIDRVNEEVRAICARKCEDARAGLQCGDCECCVTCKILEDADREITEKEERKTPQDASSSEDEE